MAADDAKDKSELDTSAPEQPPSPIQKESRKKNGWIHLLQGIQERLNRGTCKDLESPGQSG
jgi:hypothetical protein